MHHYCHPESRAVTTSWMLAELGVPYEAIVVDFHAGENDAPDFVATIVKIVSTASWQIDPTYLCA